MAKVIEKFTGCADCVAFIANGDVPEDRPDLAEDLAARWPGVYLVNADQEGEEDAGFSWSGCNCCGSPLGGNRYRLAALAS